MIAHTRIQQNKHKKVAFLIEALQEIYSLRNHCHTGKTGILQTEKAQDSILPSCSASFHQSSWL